MPPFLPTTQAYSTLLRRGKRISSCLLTMVLWIMAFSKLAKNQVSCTPQVAWVVPNFVKTAPRKTFLRTTPPLLSTAQNWNTIFRKDYVLASPRRKRSPALSTLSIRAASGAGLAEGENDDDDPEILLDHILEVAIDAAAKAGEIIVENIGADVTERKANSRDLLTKIDPLCEQTIRETVLAKFPSHGFLGEEDVPPGKEASAAAIDAKLSSTGDEWLWVVDPIDGTSNFVHAMPLCLPSIAVTRNGQVEVGVIYDPHRDEMFTAIRGRGAFMNDEPISVGEQEELGDAIVAMGSPPGAESMNMSLKGIQSLMPKARTIRMLGSAALMLAWVADGRLTCYWEYDLSSWDIAAGGLLIQEAGGKFTDLEGNDFSLRTRKICGSNGKPGVHDEILRVLREEAGVI